MSLPESTTTPHATAARPVLAIVGGVGSGKSSVSRAVADAAQEVLGGPLLVIDADRIGHEVLRTDAVKIALRDRFGGDIFDASGEVIRKALAQKVFGDSEQHRQALRDLEGVSHPAIRDELQRQIASAGPEIVGILLDAAVLLEAGWNELCDAVVFLETPEHLRSERVRSRGWDADELRRRETSQMPLDEKRMRATHVVDNSGALADSARDVLAIFTSLKQTDSHAELTPTATSTPAPPGFPT